jgi:hypothetical protein
MYLSISMYVRIYIIYIYVCAEMHVCLYLCMSVFKYICIQICAETYVCMYKHTNRHTEILPYACIYV